ncbi:TPA: hypothetical protein EYP66_06465 [Candidatus Poribacteria bacterium]|nr:hypothetical protein [Candidatus Poribacteria bacterium]
MNYRKISISTKDGKTKLISKLTEYLEYGGMNPIATDIFQKRKSAFVLKFIISRR